MVSPRRFRFGLAVAGLLEVLVFGGVASLYGIAFFDGMRPAVGATVVEQAMVAPPVPAAHAPARAVQLPALTLDSIFGAPPDLGQLDSDQLRTLLVTGDVIPGRGVNMRMGQRRDWGWPFARTADFLRNADLTFINLEAPLPKTCPILPEGMRFCGDQRFLQGIRAAGVDIASLSNNHINNFGAEGFRQTEELLTQSNIGVAHEGVIAYRDVRGLRFAFLAYNGIEQRLDREMIRRTIAEARTNADIVAVSYHWGKEYVAVPTTDGAIAPDDPREIGRFTIDAGADLVLGNHPHWVQGVELYRGKLITYAHGNFIFDQTWSNETQEGAVGKYTFYGPQLVAVEYFPVRIVDGGQAVVVSKTDGVNILEQMRSSSLTMAGNAQG
jgi:poly-gamma-glutamate synthesis protein (capsule biosynthesis protein)